MIAPRNMGGKPRSRPFLECEFQICAPFCFDAAGSGRRRLKSVLGGLAAFAKVRLDAENKYDFFSKMAIAAPLSQLRKYVWKKYELADVEVVKKPSKTLDEFQLSIWTLENLIESHLLP